MSSTVGTTARWVGKPMRRVREDTKLVSGRGSYLDDIRFGNVAHVALLRSPYAHAHIRRVDVSRAARHPGVLAVLTGDGVSEHTRPSLPRLSLPVDLKVYCLAREKVRYVGDPLAAVAAIDRATAEDAVELIDVEYEALPAVTDVEAAVAPDAPMLYEELGTNVLWHRVLPYGDVDGAFAEADLVLRDRFTIHRYASTPLETFGCVAEFDHGTSSLTLWGHSQLPGLALSSVAYALGLPVSSVRFIQPDVGGAFGNKDRASHMVVCAVLSKLTHRPVKYVEDRNESLKGLVHACDGVMYVEAAVKRDGTILGMKFRNLSNEGSSTDFAAIHNMLQLTNLVNCYRFKAVSYEGSSVVSNKCPAGANRGVGKPFMAFAMERMIDRIAQSLERDPAEVRFRNFIQPDEFPYSTPSGNLYDSGDYPETLRRALAAVDYPRLREEQAEARTHGRYLGIGIATTVEPSQANFGYGLLVSKNQSMTGIGEGARVKVEFDGRVTVSTGGTDTGQGHETVISQIVADELGVIPDNVRVLPFDSAISPWLPASGNYADKFSGTDTGAILGAVRKVRQKVVDLAAQQFEANASDIEISDGMVYVRGVPARSKPLGAIVAPAYFGLSSQEGREPGVEALHYHANPMANVPDEQDRVRAQLNFANSAHIAVVSVDPETFEVSILRYVAAHDVGVQLNPLIVEGQLHGSTVHGIAAALLEEFVYDEQGQFLTGSFMDYLKPTSADVPEIEAIHLETPSPFTPLGTKGAGEGGALPAPAAIASAVEDALAPLGVRISGLPIKPSSLWATASGWNAGSHDV
jgi:2-furoyl-CoA dehydrogenase large subunit